MVVNNTDPESGGAKEGLLAIAAIAVVLFFVIKIYADYVTATGQAVKPGQKKQAAARPSSRTSTADEEPLDRSVSTESPEETSRRDRKRMRADEAQRDDENTTERAAERRRRRTPADEEAAADSRGGLPRVTAPGQIVIEREPDDTERAETAPAPRRSRTGVPPRPRPVDEAVVEEDRTPGDAEPRTASRTELFARSRPYPGDFDDVQVGDRLSEITGMRLPGGRLSRSVYSYRPKEGPFKTIYAILSAGPVDPQVTGVVYLFRGSKQQAEVHRQAVETFGDGDAVRTTHGERRQWPHLNGYAVSIERDRYMVEQDLTAAGRRYLHRAGTAPRD